MRAHLTTLRLLLEYLGGVTELPPGRGWHWLESPIVWGLWWSALVLLVLTFGGQSSKFIYIDF